MNRPWQEQLETASRFIDALPRDSGDWLLGHWGGLLLRYRKCLLLWHGLWLYGLVQNSNALRIADRLGRGMLRSADAKAQHSLFLRFIACK